MNRYLSFRRLGMMFLAIFAVLVGAAFAYERFWADPGRRCEDGGKWYDISTRTCATPIYIPDITGRQPGESREQASRRKAAELIELEARAAAQQQAIDDDAHRQRETFENRNR